MIHYVEITNIKKNDINYHKANKRGYRAYSFLLLLILPVFAMGCLRLYSTTTLSGIYSNVLRAYNPIYSPYSETSNIVFTTSDDKVGDFELPIISSKTKIDQDGTVSAEVKESILIKSVADGVVDKIEDRDGVKVIVIRHGKDLRVEYINIDVAGVNVGNIVRAGKEIGTAKLGSTVSFKAYLANKQVKGFKIENNKLVWQN